MTDSVPIVQVVGGAGGLAASHAEVRQLGDRFGRTGNEARSWAETCGSVLVDGDLLASAALAPVSFARAEAAVLEAAGAGVLDWLVWEGDALLFHGTVDLLEAADQCARAALDALDYTALRVVATPFAPLAVVGDAVPDPTWDRLTDRLIDRLIDRLGPVGAGHAPGMVDELVVDHPDVVRHLLNGSGGLLDGLTLGLLPFVLHPTARAAAADAASWYDVPGHAAVGTGQVQPSTGPRSLEELIQALADVNDLPDGTIAVQSIGGAHVVYLPGTDALGLPWDFDPDVRDGQTDLAAVAGLPNAYADGVGQALAQAGVGDEPVLLVGHSLGGIVAAQLAHGHGLNVAGVITAGSPLASTPDGIPVLSLENRGDVVPMLLGDEPADTVDHVTVRFDDHEASVVGNHELGHYVAGAAALDASVDESIREQLAGWSSYLTGASGTTQTFTMTRVR